MPKSKIIKNYLYTLVGQVLNIIIPIITTPYISRVLGATNIGIYSYTLSISTYFIVVGSLGFPLYGQREIAFVAHDKKKLSNVFFKIMYAQLALLTITLLLYFPVVIYLLKDNLEIQLLQSIGIIGGVFATSWLYYGIEEFKVTVAKNIFVKLFATASVFIFVKAEADLPLYTAIIGLSNVIGNLIILVDAKKYVDFKQFRVKLSDIFLSIKPALILGIPYYITSIYAVIDRTMLGSMGSGYSEVGYYEQSQKIVLLLMSVITSIGTVMLPRLANDLGQNKKDEAKRLLNRGTDLVLLLSFPVCMGLIVVGDMIVPWFFGPGYEKVGILIQLFAPLMVINGLSNLLGNQYLVAQKKEKVLSITILFSIIINLGLNWLLIPRFDAIGATIATLVAEFIKVIIQFYMVNDVNFEPFIKCLGKYLGLSLAMSLFVYMIRKMYFTQANFLNCVLLAGIGMVIYLIELLVVRDKNTEMFLTAIRDKISKKLN